MKKILLRLWYDSVPVLAAFAALTAAVWGKAQKSKADEFEKLADEYASICVSACSRCSSELKDTVTDMSFSLDKLRVTASQTARVLALEDIVRLSAVAAEHLSRLPRSQVDIMELESFLIRAGDYARTLSGGLLAGREPGETDIAQLEAMLEACRGLAERLEERISSGEMPVGTEEYDYYEASADRDGAEYPTLVYDGPKAAAADEIPPKCAGEPETDPAAALEFAECIAEESMRPVGGADGKLPCLEFENGDGTASVTITKNGMHPVSVMRPPSGDRSDKPTAEELARIFRAAMLFLEKAGFEDMTPTFVSRYDGAAAVSFVWRTGDALVLSDSLSVLVDRETFRVIGLDARQYFYNHCEREIERPALSREEAEQAVSPSIEVSRTRLALLNVTPFTETLCWEVRGDGFGGEYVIYVNAQTGAEERIVRIVSDEYGERTV